MTVPDAPVLSYTQEAFSVKVENIPESANREEIVSLFRNLVGKVRKYEHIKTPSGVQLQITFADRDSFEKALKMSGCTVDGRSLLITPSSPLQRISNQQKLDARRNLYVLGLPFSLTKAEFTEIFSRYGTVSHCVILATVDSSSRRRGFVVMSTNDEAKSAMTHLSRTQIKGHTLDISWAVVQRSRGFLDGGDRSSILDTRTPETAPQDNILQRRPVNSARQPIVSLGNVEDRTRLTASRNPASTILVSNLPTFLFSQPQDLYPLFFPFGSVKKLEILAVQPVHFIPCISVTVEYATTSGAQEAKEALDGQLYADYMLKAEFVEDKPTDGVFRHKSTISSPVSNEPVNTSSLNPFAAPFVFGNSCLSSPCAPSTFGVSSANQISYPTPPIGLSAVAQLASRSALPQCFYRNATVPLSFNSTSARPYEPLNQPVRRDRYSTIATNVPVAHQNWYTG